MKIRILELENQVTALKADVAESSLKTIECENKMATFHVSSLTIPFSFLDASTHLS